MKENKLECHHKGKSNLKSYALIKDAYSIEGESFFSSKGFEGKDYFEVQGRWINNGKAFATLASPIIFQQICINAILREPRSKGFFRSQDVIFKVGNTRWGENHSLFFYRPMLKEKVNSKFPEKIYYKIYQDPCGDDLSYRYKNWVAVFIKAKRKNDD